MEFYKEAGSCNRRLAILVSAPLSEQNAMKLTSQFEEILKSSLNISRS
jgi:hypothetical protein